MREPESLAQPLCLPRAQPRRRLPRDGLGCDPTCATLAPLLQHEDRLRHHPLVHLPAYWMMRVMAPFLMAPSDVVPRRSRCGFHSPGHHAVGTGPVPRFRPQNPTSILSNDHVLSRARPRVPRSRFSPTIPREFSGENLPIQYICTGSLHEYSLHACRGKMHAQVGPGPAPAQWQICFINEEERYIHIQRGHIHQIRISLTHWGG